MARRTASAQLIHANPGPAAPLIHASVGPAAPLASAPHLGSAPLTSAPHVGGGGRTRRGADGDGAGGGNAPVAVLSEQAAAGSGAAMRGIKGRTETVASIGSRKFNAAQVRSAIDRGLQGQRLSREDQAIYDAYNARNKKAQEDAAAKAAETKAEQDRRNKLADQIALQNNQAANHEASAVAADNRKNAETLRKEKAEAEAAAQKQADEDAAEEAWNSRYGVDKGTRLSANEKKNVENGTHAWGVDPSVTKKYEQDKKELQSLLVDGEYTEEEYAEAMRNLNASYRIAPRGIYQKPQDPSMPNIRTVGGRQFIQNGANGWKELSQTRGAADIVDEARQNGGYYMSPNGEVKVLPSTPQEIERRQSAEKAESERKAREASDRKWVENRAKAIYAEMHDKDEGYVYSSAILAAQKELEERNRYLYPEAPKAASPKPASPSAAPASAASGTYNGKSYT